ncbi:MAG: hypothetical protein ACHQ49_18560 [Elusimicrobiota bacterium]
MDDIEPGIAARWGRRLRAAAVAAARVQAAVLLTLVYWLFLGPAAAAARLLGADPLARRRPAKSGWIARPQRGARETLAGAG